MKIIRFPIWPIKIINKKLYSAVYYKRGPFHFHQSSLGVRVCICIICSSFSSVSSRIILELIAVHLIILLVSSSEMINPAPSFALVLFLHLSILVHNSCLIQSLLLPFFFGFTYS